MNIVLALLLACSTPSEPSKSAPAPVAPPSTPPPSSAPTAAHQEHEHMEGEHDEHEGAATAPTAVPDSYAGIITELQTRKANLATILAAGSLKEIHPQAQVVMDLAVALPGKASADSKAMVSLKALDLKEKADALHDHADEGDAPGAKAAFDAVSADIDALAAAK